MTTFESCSTSFSSNITIFSGVVCTVRILQEPHLDFMTWSQSWDNRGHSWAVPCPCVFPFLCWNAPRPCIDYISWVLLLCAVDGLSAWTWGLGTLQYYTDSLYILFLLPVLTWVIVFWKYSFYDGVFPSRTLHNSSWFQTLGKMMQNPFQNHCFPNPQSSIALTVTSAKSAYWRERSENLRQGFPPPPPPLYHHCSTW